MTTVLLGVGERGSLVVVRLAAGSDMLLGGHPSPHPDAIAVRGLRLQVSPGTASLVPLRIATDLDRVSGARAVIVLVMARAIAEAPPPPLAPLLSAAAIVVTLRNGLGNLQLLTSVLPDHPSVQWPRGPRPTAPSARMPSPSSKGNVAKPCSGCRSARPMHDSMSLRYP